MKLSNRVLRTMHHHVGVGRPSYAYRNLPAMSKVNPSAWCISGYDRYNDHRGILEWCHDEQDARVLLARMSEFPKQFDALHLEQFSKVDWLRTQWDTHY